MEKPDRCCTMSAVDAASVLTNGLLYEYVYTCVGRRCRHRALIGACVSALSERMDDVASSTEWETEWLSLDREQLVEFIRSSELTVKDEWDLWQVGHITRL